MIYGIAAPEKALEASDDGQTFHVVAQLANGGAPQNTDLFPRSHGKVFPHHFQAHGTPASAGMGCGP